MIAFLIIKYLITYMEIMDITYMNNNLIALNFYI